MINEQSYTHYLVQQNESLRMAVEKHCIQINLYERKIIRITTARWWTRLLWVFTGVKA